MSNNCFRKLYMWCQTKHPIIIGNGLHLYRCSALPIQSDLGAIMSITLVNGHHYTLTKVCSHRLFLYFMHLLCKRGKQLNNNCFAYKITGQDLNAATTTVYPHDQVFMVGSNITFCCIVETDKVPSSEFLIRISNRTYIKKTVQFKMPGGPDIHCDVEGDPSGSTIFIGCKSKCILFNENCFI